ncbi:Hypothetical protein, putative [Bodo saltans]|uniref:Uncharacterized protein n=1 Tax=Bodo saltans TaxID=75058 RepID=A0A0S4IR97_BODSA|nr:Hypothetical protein, putative [Bodo saltans]|eukprot:CUF34036.1 Hypothetical protein, putative [Bodo saltans]
MMLLDCMSEDNDVLHFLRVIASFTSLSVRVSPKPAILSKDFPLTLFFTVFMTFEVSREREAR